MTSSNLEYPLQPSLNGVSSALNGKVNENLIEQFVRFPETLDGATLAVIKASLEKYKKDMAIERFYRQFYAEYDKLEARISSNVTAFVSSLFD